MSDAVVRSSVKTTNGGSAPTTSTPVDLQLAYQSGVKPGALGLNQATIQSYHTPGASGTRWWMLWMMVKQDGGTARELIGIPVNPNGSDNPSGAGGYTYGIQHTTDGLWSLSTQVNLLGNGTVHAGAHPTLTPLWAHVPQLTGVPTFEPFTVLSP